MPEQPAAHVEMDAEGVVTGWDDGAEKLFGYSADEAPRWRLIVRPSCAGAHARARARRGGRRARATVEVPALDAFGRSFLVELTIAELHAPPARFRGTISVVGAHSATAEPDSADR